MIKTKFVFNPLTGKLDTILDKNSILIPDGIPSPWDASGGTFPTTTAGVADRWVIEVAGTLPAPVGAVDVQDFIIRDGTSWTVIHSPQQKYFPATQIIYVDKNRADVYTPDGSFDRPFLTIMEAVNTIALIGASEYYTIEIANGIYDENIVLENTGLKYLKIQGNGYVNINPATDNSLQSLADNDNLFALHLDNLTFSKPVKIKGANGTGMLQDTIWNEINFIDSATLDATCVNNISMKSCYSDQDMTFENVPYIHMESTQNQGDLTLIGDSFVNAPSGGVAMQVHPYGTYESGNVSYMINGTATMEIVPNGCRRGRGDVTVPAGVTIYAHNSYLRGEVTNKGVIYLRNSFIQEYVDGGGTLDITKNPGSQVDYDNTGTGLSSDNVQDAITELDAITESILTISNEIFINPTASEIPGIRHQSFASAFAWIATNSPSSYNNRRVVKINGYITENLTGANAIPRYVAIVGIDKRCCGILGSVDFLERGDDRLPRTNMVMNCMISDLALTNLPGAIGKGICLLNVKVVNCSSTGTGHYMYANGCSLEGDFIAFDGTSGTSAKTNIINSSFESWSYLTRIPKAEWVITSCQFGTGGSPQLIIGGSGNGTAIKDSFFEAWGTIIFEGTITLEDCDFITGSADVQIPSGSYIRANNTIFRSNVVVNTGGTLESVDMIILGAYDVIEAGGIWTNKGASYNNSTSGLSSTNVQSAIDELAGMANNQIIDITYADLLALKNASELIPGMKYKITDFQSIMAIGNTNDEYTTGNIEELVVTATSKNTISNEVKSMQFPQDDIWYDVTDNTITTKGSQYLEGTYTFPITVTGPSTFTILVDDGDSLLDYNMRIYDRNGSFSILTGTGVGYTAVDLTGGLREVTLTGYAGDLATADIKLMYSESEAVTLNITGANTFELITPSPLIFDSNSALEVEDGNSNYIYVDFSTLGTDWSYVDMGGNTYVITINPATYTGDIQDIINGLGGWLSIGFSMLFLNKKGTIYNRKDTIKNIETNYDFRTAKSRIWDLDMSGRTYDPTFAYVKGNWMWYSSTVGGDNWIYYCLVGNTGVAPFWSEKHRVKVFQYTIGTPLSYSNGSMSAGLIYISTLATYNDLPVFCDDVYTYNDNNINNYYNNIPINSHNYPVFCNTSVNNVELHDFSKSISYGASMDNIKIMSGTSTVFKGEIYDISITNCENNILSYSNRITANNLLFSTLANSYTLNLEYAYGFMTNLFSESTAISLNTVVIGSFYNSNKRRTINKINNTTFLNGSDIVIGGYISNSEFGQVARSTFNCWFDQYRQDVTLSDLSLYDAVFIGYCYNNYVYNNISGTYCNFSNNYIYGALDYCIHDVLFANNYLYSNMNKNVIPSFMNNGTALVGFYGAVNENILTGFSNNVCPILKSILNNTGNLLTNSTFNAEYIRNNITEVNGSIFNGDTKYNTLAELNGTTVGGIMQYNTGGGISQCTLGTFRNNNIIGRISAVNLSMATHVAAAYSTNIMSNTGLGYIVNWMDSLTGFNYDTITA